MPTQANFLFVRWALVAMVAAPACAHSQHASAPAPASDLSQARESVRQEARLKKMEAQLVALEARVQTLQAQARALRESQHQMKAALPVEAWQQTPPVAIERWVAPEGRAIEGHGDQVRLSVKRQEGSLP